MKLSMETYTLRKRFGDEEAIKMIKAAGFDCYDYSLYWTDEKDDMLGEDYKERAEALRKTADEIGIGCNQAHAPFEFKYGEERSEACEAYRRLVRSLEFAAILGAETIIVHAIKNLPEGVDFEEYNRKFYSSFIPYCERFGITISVENLFNFDGENYIGVLSNPEEHVAFVKSLKSDRFNICVDVGHSTITGHKPEDVIAAMDKNILRSLHIHDNYGNSDMHNIPMFGVHDWDKIMAALKKIGYEGDFTLEITAIGRYENEMLGHAIAFAGQTGRHLIKKFKA